MMVNEIVLVILTVIVGFGCFAIKQLKTIIESQSKSYGAELGKINAMNEKLDVLSEQTSELTSAKNLVDHDYWRKREAEQVKKDKLDEAYRTVLIVDQQMMEQYGEMLSKVSYGTEIRPKTIEGIPEKIRLEMLINLYFPNLRGRYESFQQTIYSFGELFSDILLDQTHPTQTNVLKEKNAEVIKAFEAYGAVSANLKIDLCKISRIVNLVE